MERSRSCQGDQTGCDDLTEEWTQTKTCKDADCGKISENWIEFEQKDILWILK